MNSFEKKIQSVLVSTVPLPPDTAHDWEDVVRRAGASEKAADVVRARRSTRSYLARRLVLVLVLAAAALAIGLIAPWQHGRSFTDSAVAERALVAIGNGPVLHVVLRREGGLKGGGWSYIDLASGKETPMSDTEEIWYDSERRFEHLSADIERASASSQDDRFSREILQTPAGTWASYNIDPGKPHAPVLDPALSEFLNGYRSALENGTAHVTGTGVVDGRDVTWIEFRVKPGCTRTYYACVERVAIDETSSLPLQIAWYRKGKLVGSIDIVSIETSQAGSGDFSKPEKRPSRSYRMGRDQVASITPADAAQALPGALWAGESIATLQLSNVSRARLMTQTNESAPFYEIGIQLHYGDGSPAVLWPETSATSKEPSGGVVVLQEEKSDPNFWFWPYPAAPAGSMLTNNGGEGWLVKDGTYVFIHASSQELLLAAARALKPIQP